MRYDNKLSKSCFSIVAIGMVATYAFAFCIHGAIAAEQAKVPSKPEISVRADRGSVQIADPFEFTVEVTASDGASVQFPTVPQQLGPFEVIDHRDLFGVPVESDNGASKWNRRFTLETLKTGELYLPPMEVSVRSANQSLVKLVTPVLRIEVVSVLEPASDPANFVDIHDLIDVPEPTRGAYGWILWVAAGGIGLAALAAGAAFLFRGRTNWKTPADWAMSELGNLPTNSTQSCARIEQIVRSYIEEEYHLPATSYSPQELQQALLQVGASKSTLQQLSVFLSKAEQVKYAGLKVSDHEYVSAKESVIEIIKSLDSIPESTCIATNSAPSSREVV